MIIKIKYETLSLVFYSIILCILLSLTVDIPGVDIPDPKDILELIQKNA